MWGYGKLTRRKRSCTTRRQTTTRRRALQTPRRARRSNRLSFLAGMRAGCMHPEDLTRKFTTSRRSSPRLLYSWTRSLSSSGTTSSSSRRFLLLLLLPSFFKTSLCRALDLMACGSYRTTAAAAAAPSWLPSSTAAAREEMIIPSCTSRRRKSDTSPTCPWLELPIQTSSRDTTTTSS